MEINENKSLKQPTNDKTTSTYKVKDENINKMHEYLKKQSNANNRRN